jgi:phosphatidylglycerol---prolipoprotein diacylglyceryl transferase
MPDNGIYLAWGWFTKGQLLSIPLVLLGLYLIVRSRTAPVLQPVAAGAGEKS